VRRILEDALRLGAHGMVVAHNHPSGDPQPSADDVASTRELSETAARLGIRLHDHLIFAGGEAVSLRSLGLL
jgi:DNA repair protein RadC